MPLKEHMTRKTVVAQLLTSRMAKQVLYQSTGYKTVIMNSSLHDNYAARLKIDLPKLIITTNS